jgi:8-oxo-dGTP pyrophosphatase MutT (NUDIX family)
MTPEAPRIDDIEDVVFDVEARAWPFAIDQGEAIDRHWEKQSGKNPHLFNGRVFLNFERRIEALDHDDLGLQQSKIVNVIDSDNLERDAGGKPGAAFPPPAPGVRRVLRGTAAAVDFKAFLAWRDFGFPDGGVRNCFAVAALLSADGAFMLGRMSERTANAGKIYFPAGTPDLGDVKDGALDLAGSAARELFEETGIRADEVAFAPGWTVVFEEPRIACMKTARSPLTASEIEVRFKDFIARQEAPELVALHPVFSVRDLDEERMPGFTLRYLRHALSEESV